MIATALTLWRPWAEAIAFGPKRVENRPWMPPLDFFTRAFDGPSRLLVLHAGLRWDPDGEEFCRDLWPECPTEEASKANVGRLLAVCRIVKAHRVHDERGCGDAWSFGPWCWHLSDVVRLDVPDRVRGRQGLFGLDEPFRSIVLDAWRKRP